MEARVNPASDAAAKIHSEGLAAYDRAIERMGDLLADVREQLADLREGRAAPDRELTADRSDAATERQNNVALIRAVALEHRPPGEGSRLDPVGLALAEIANRIERRERAAGETGELANG